MLKERFFDSGGVRLHYIDWGGDGSALVLLAGLGGTAHIYRALAPRLASRFRVAGLTRRGHGRSGRPASDYGPETLVEDIRRFLDALAIERAILVGHSFAGIEMPLFATRYPQRVEAIVYLDAIHPLLGPEPDRSKDPVLSQLPAGPAAADLVSRAAYLAYHRRARPDLAGIWCEAIEANLLADMTIEDERPVLDRHGAEVTGHMFRGLGQHRDPDYSGVTAPMLAIVPAGQSHPFTPRDAADELRAAADAYWAEHFLPRIRRRTKAFREAAPTARIVELDASNHIIFLAEEDATVQAIFDFLPH